MFAVHPDFKSHTGAVFTLGKGIIVLYIKSRGSTEYEIIGVDNQISKLI